MPSLLDRGRDLVQQAAVATGVRAPPPEPEPSLIDHAQRHLEALGTQVGARVREASPWAGERLDEAAAAAVEMERKGFSKHVKEFNASLLRPLQDGTSEVLAVARATATCAPGQDARKAFALWNVLCFWLGVVILLLDFVLPMGMPLIELVGVIGGYAAAYTLHFIFVRVPQKAWMRAALLVLALYVSYNVFAGVGGLVLVVPGAIAFARAGANAVLLWYAWTLYGQHVALMPGGPAAMV